MKRKKNKKALGWLAAASSWLLGTTVALAQGGDGATLHQPLILVHPPAISSVESLMPALLLAAKMGRPLLVIAEDVDGDQLATLVVNRLHGSVSAQACKAPGFGDRRKAMLEDIVVLTGGRLIQEDLGVRLEGVSAEDLGSASEALVDPSGTTTIVVDPSAQRTREAIAQRLRSLRQQLERGVSAEESRDLEQRIAALQSGRLRLGAEPSGSAPGGAPSGDRTANALVWEYDLGALPRGSHPTSLTVRNAACKGAHTFTLTVEGRSWLRITGSTVLEGVELGSTKTTAAVAELTGLERGEHRAVVLIRCLTCPSPPLCSQNLSRIEARVTVISN